MKQTDDALDIAIRGRYNDIDLMIYDDAIEGRPILV